MLGVEGFPSTASALCEEGSGATAAGAKEGGTEKAYGCAQTQGKAERTWWAMLFWVAF